MLKSITLENYKCFKDPTTIEIAPLTVLCGVNSSGKSSILKSLLMLKQTAEGKFSEPLMLLSGDLVDCGTFDSIINSKTEKNTFFIRNRFEINNHKLATTGTFIKRQDAKEFNELEKIYSSINQTIIRFIFDTEIEVERCVDSENEFSPYLSNNRIKSYKIIINIEGENGLIQEFKGDISFNFFNGQNSNYETKEPHRLSWNGIPYLYKRGKNDNFQNDLDLKLLGYFNNYKCSCTFNGLAISNVFAYDMKPFIKAVIPNILSITRIISNQYSGVNYIAPLRNTPQRTYLINKNVNSVGINGENAPILLAKYKKQVITTDMYCPATNTIEPDENGYITAKFEKIIQQWLDYFELGKLGISGDKNGTVSLQFDKHNIVDVGFGASQVLPIIIQGIFMDKEQTLIVEQPEIHLHPKMELLMADFLIRIAETGRNIIIETHSDHIKTRLIRRIIEDDCRKLQDNIKIYFITQEEKGVSKSLPIDFNDEYGIANNPDGFFDQAANEQLELMKSGLLKREKIRENMI